MLPSLALALVITQLKYGFAETLRLSIWQTFARPKMDNKKLRDTFALPIDKKSRILALILWFFLGAFGVHRMYLGRAGSGVVMAILTLIGGATAAIGIGFVFLAIVAIWWVLDFILIFVIAGRHNSAVDAMRHGRVRR